MKRWTANVIYRSANGPVSVIHDIEELDEISDLVERGPDWNSIEKIEIILALVSEPGLLVEDAI